MRAFVDINLIFGNNQNAFFMLKQQKKKLYHEIILKKVMLFTEAKKFCMNLLKLTNQDFKLIFNVNLNVDKYIIYIFYLLLLFMKIKFNCYNLIISLIICLTLQSQFFDDQLPLINKL